ncbi:site-specific integrase [Mesorhizobium sp. M4A.F.Ca.ET.050.02.1.1]|nr:site-specific integrase [Mesorhizobium sp. M4A.F.Ca.ET.050.02.1.1]RWD36100.1 MAG: site-specific integrase [Mesorhizobium sp.]TIT73830.1 MAG: site-specific integrase [Mesorhizobium sp.]TIT95080.1 MAG: site-specific integrase [Mesorhizobium sp.]
MASFRKRGNSWHVQIRRTGFPTLTASFSLKADAVLWAREQEQRIDRRDILPSVTRLDSITLDSLLRRYETAISVRKRGADRESFKIRVLLRSPMAGLPLSKLTSTMIAAYRDQRLATVKPATVRRELALLRHCLEVARREWGIPLSRNPFEGVKLPSVQNARDRRLEHHEQNALGQALKGSRAWYLAPMLELAVETGMRRGELLSLEWKHVDLDARTAILPLTKNGNSRKVPLTTRAATVLSKIPVRGETVFPISPGAFRQAWERLVKTGLKNLLFHDLRHEAVSRFFEMGLSVPEVALISGHRDYRMLFRYTHIRPEDVARKLR